MGQGEVAGVTHRVLCTWQLLSMAVKATWLALGSVQAGKVSWALSGCLPTESGDYCMLINGWAWLRSRVCILSLKVQVFVYGARAKIEMNILWCITACVCYR